MEFARLEYSGHAIRRMFERNISESDVRAVVTDGQVIIEYKDDKPFPSFVMLGKSSNRPLHVVAGYDAVTGLLRIITVYVPDDFLWDDNFSARKQQ